MKQTTQTHSPLPWYIGEPIRSQDAIGICNAWEDVHEGEGTIAEVLPGILGIAQADAELIVKAVNNHQRLIDALEDLLTEVDNINPDIGDDDFHNAVKDAWELLKEVQG